ncbi:nucleotide exchange factor GrpE [Melioribacter sp. OK-6-Me]|uniref:nucleotide exchange factor GrpE n=1 Tax=unclassified Melioribacter TaxID=2627329 RepID=UPI003ED8BDD4
MKKKTVKKETEEVKINQEKEIKESEQTQTTTESQNEENEKEKDIIKELNEKLEQLEKENSELKDTLLRKVAEFENYKRRTEQDQLNIIKYAAEPFIKSILTVYDDLQRSLSHINDINNYDAMKKGLELVFEKFTKTLEAQGVKKIDAKGQPFDFEMHEALMQQPVEGLPPHTVVDVVEPGYIYKDKVIRHAKVIVSADSPENQNNEEGK